MKLIKNIVALTLVLCISLLCACGSTQRPTAGATYFSGTTTYATISIGAGITQELSPLDAYYVGLTDHCELVDRWGLAKSTHDR